jgi:hypothetical protein
VLGAAGDAACRVKVAVRGDDRLARQARRRLERVNVLRVDAAEEPAVVEEAEQVVRGRRRVRAREELARERPEGARVAPEEVQLEDGLRVRQAERAEARVEPRAGRAEVGDARRDARARTDHDDDPLGAPRRDQRRDAREVAARERRRGGGGGGGGGGSGAVAQGGELAETREHLCVALVRLAGGARAARGAAVLAVLAADIAIERSGARAERRASRIVVICVAAARRARRCRPGGGGGGGRLVVVGGGGRGGRGARRVGCARAGRVRRCVERRWAVQRRRARAWRRRLRLLRHGHCDGRLNLQIQPLRRSQGASNRASRPCNRGGDTKERLCVAPAWCIADGCSEVLWEEVERQA